MDKIENKNSSRPVDGSFGTPLWKVNHYRSKMLTALLDDLVELESVGADVECFGKICLSLEYFINALTEVPNDMLSGKPLYEMVEDFLDLCQEWNEVKGTGRDSVFQRRLIIRKLRKVRQRISNKTRKLQYQLENNTDIQMLSDAYKAIGGIMNLLPDTFRHVGKAVKKYLRID